MSATTDESSHGRVDSIFDHGTFGENATFNIEQPVGAMSISPCGRDLVLAS